MLTIRCTRKLLKHLDLSPVKEPESSTGRLGDWYSNLVPTYAGELIVFASERTLLTVAIPAWQAGTLDTLFRARVRNLLAMLGVSREAAEKELSHYHEILYAKTANRSVLGSLNDIAFNYQVIAEQSADSRTLSLSDTENRLSHMPSIARGFFPDKEARRLLELQSQSNGAS